MNSQLPDLIAGFFTEKLSVSNLTTVIKGTLEALTSEHELTVEGEVSTFRPASSGHWYFNLKDEKAMIAAVVWRSTAARLGFRPKDGQKVVVKGRLSVYEPSGGYKLICSSIVPAGEGDILALIEERKRKYSALGWFDESLKKPIPTDARRIGVVTSPTGAAFQDILNVSGRRSPSTDILIFPCPVQGVGAAEEIAARIDQANRFGACDVLIVGRGGGSVEDLLPFSEECVIEAIHNSAIPVISAVGHEIDWALSDFVADRRAPTPSAAAELACPDNAEKLRSLRSGKETLVASMRSRLTTSRLMLSSFSKESARTFLTNRLDTARMRLDALQGTAMTTMKTRLADARKGLETSVSRINDLSPVAVLSRGYAIVSDDEGNNVKDAAQVSDGQSISIRLSNSTIDARVDKGETR